MYSETKCNDLFLHCSFRFLPGIALYSLHLVDQYALLIKPCFVQASAEYQDQV